MAQNTVRETCCNHSNPSPPQDCLSTMTEDISKLNKEKHFPQIENYTQLQIIHIAHWTVNKTVIILKLIPQDLLSCMKSVGMNPSEQELLDMINEVRIGFRIRKNVINVCYRLKRKVSSISRMFANSFSENSARMMSQNSSR